MMAPLPALPEGCSSTLVVHVRSSESINARSYWIPGFYAPPVFEKRSVLLRQLKKKGFKEEWVAKVGADDPDNSPTLESNKSLQEDASYRDANTCAPQLLDHLAVIRSAPGLPRQHWW
jgi:hypothetical protein